MSANRFRLIRFLLHCIIFIAILLAIPLSTPLPVTAKPDHEFIVDTTDDTVDVSPGNGLCADSTGKCSLRAAIQETNSLAGADRIILYAGKYILTRAGGGENNAATGDLDISGVLTIDGTLYDTQPYLRSEIDAGQLDRVFDIKSTANVTMNYLVIGNGKVPNNPIDGVGGGGGIYNQGTLQLNGCLVDANKSGIVDGYYVIDAPGGGIYNLGPSLTLINTTIWANSTSNGGNYYTSGNHGGGIASLAGSLTITGGLIWQNTTGNGGDGTDTGASGGNGGRGGGISLNGGTANLTNVIIQENTTGNGGAGASGQYGGGGGHGGGIAVNSGNLTMTGGSVLNNTTGHGGAGSNVSGFGSGGVGGGISVVAGSPSLVNTTISGNSTGNGGLTGGRGGYGGGIYCALIPFTATNLTLTNNHTGDSAATSNYFGADGSWGGGLYAYGCSVSINGGTIQGNYTGNGGNGTGMGGYGGFGGGIAHESSGSDTLTNLTISGNWAGNGGDGTFAGGPGGGGGIYAGNPSLTGCTVSGNTAGNAGSGSGGVDGGGGGLYTNGSAYITNSTISGNSTGSGKSNGDGGGVYADGYLYLRSSTVTNNTSSGYDGGVNRAYARNSILANNSAPNSPDCEWLSSEGYNLVKDASCSIYGDTIGNLTGVDPLLGSLADNGGPTLTHALGSSSRAIDAANPATPGSGGNACPATDQRGGNRSDLRCDIGAFESSSGGSTTVSRVLDPDQMTVFGATLVSMTLTSTPSIFVTVSKHGQAPTGLPTNVEPVPVYWEITPPTDLIGISNAESAETAYNLNLSLCYKDQEVTGKDESQLQMWHKIGGIWTKQDSTADPAHNCVTAPGVTELSTWTLATPIPACQVHLNNISTYYPTIQAAVDASTNPDDLVKVAGTCSGINHYSGLAQTVFLTKTLTIQGGYTTTNWTTPDPIANPTTLDAQGLGRVMLIIGDVSPTIAGLRITGGNAEGLGGGPSGADGTGGIGIGNGSPTIRDCEIFSNTADVAGGISMGSDHSLLINNFIHDNHANQTGGGVVAHLSHATLTWNIIQENVSGGNGGGLDMGESEMTLSYNSILTNTSGASADGGYGGGLSADKTRLTFDHNLVSGNRSIYRPAVDDGGYGGGVYLNQSDASLTGNQITDNQSGWGAGGLAIDYLSSVNVQDNIIAHNDAGEEGGGIGIYLSHPVTLTNNVITDNTAGSAGYGGRGAGGVGAGLSAFGGTSLNLKHNTFARNSGLSGIYVDRSWFWLDWPTSLVMTNTILISHTVGISVTGGNTVTVNSILWDSFTPITVTQGVTAVVSILNQHTGDPAFEPDGYHLTSHSAAIDKGVAAAVFNDIDTQPRPMNAGYDLGADEYPEIIPLTGGSGSVSTPDHVLTFTWSLAQPITLTYASQLTTTNSTGDFNFAGIVFHLEATDQFGNPVIIPASPLTLVLHYNDADLPPGTVESYLKLYRYDSTLGWIPLTVLGRDTVANTLTVQLNHFSDFALLAKQQKIVYLPSILR